MNSISKAIITLRWKSNTQVDILSRKLTQKCDVTEQRMAVKFVLALKVNFWDVGFAVLTYIWSVWYEGYVIQVVRYFYWKRLLNTTILVLMERIVISCSRHQKHVWHCHLFKSISIPYKKNNKAKYQKLYLIKCCCRCNDWKKAFSSTCLNIKHITE